MIGWNGGSAGAYSFLTLPGGGTLAGSLTANGTTTTWVPIIDASGSTIALVNAASTQSPATTYTYDPSGTPTLSGATNLWPFLYKGMEQESIDAPYYYTGSGQFYSPQLTRSLSEAGETGSQGACPSGNAIGAPSGSSGSGLYFPGGFDIGPQGSSKSGQTTITVTGAGAGGATIGAVIGAAVGAPGAGAVIGGAVGAIVGGIASLVDDLFGGGSPPTPRQLLHNRHPLYPVILGIQDGLIPDEAPSGNPQAQAQSECVGCSSVNEIPLIGASFIVPNPPLKKPTQPGPFLPPPPKVGPPRFIPLPPYTPNPNDPFDRPYPIPMPKLPRPDKFSPGLIPVCS